MLRMGSNWFLSSLSPIRPELHMAEDDAYYEDWDDNALFEVPLEDQAMAWDNDNDDDDDDLPIDHLLNTTTESDDQQATNSDANDAQSSQTLRSRLAGPSTNKAGLDSVDKDKVNRIIYEASKGSAFFENERKRDQMVTERIERMMAKYDKIRDLDLSMETRITDRMIHGLESERDLSQVICHVDMDAFYASVEELEHPELKTVPMAVGGTAMLCTSNYEARKFGVRSAMPGYIALKLCPHLKIIPLHFDKYRAASNKVRAIFAKYDPDFAPMSLDEAYLNLTNYLKTTTMSPPEVVQQIRQEIFEETQLTASAGIGANKMLSKICSDMNKPNGQYYLPNDINAIRDFIKDLSIRKIPGIGRVTERILSALGVSTCSDVYERRAVLYRLLSPVAFKSLLRSHLGMGSTSVQVKSSQKSMGVERTFRPISTRSALFQKVDELAELLSQDLDQKHIKGKTVGIKLKLTTFEVRVRAKTLPYHIHKACDIARYAKELLEKEMPLSLRLMGVKLSSLERIGNDGSVEKFFRQIPAKRLREEKEEEEKEEEDRSSPDKTEPEASHSSPTEQQEKVECPICNRSLQLDNAAFNRHVDECLNRVEVRSILVSERDTSSSSSSPAPSSKKHGSLFDYYSREPPASSS
ncbi:dna-directed polymerase kappa [Lichtheimia corymbifera JMRC:FSU:9682]|uniref:DNA polymerase kappa n=1 Tax=Lichtheimia corymbifera JMRC:FSU:9682 TaxID=1263082 RepID=A0A068RJW9_9FUNG|nr:dna-directed polymerase kappa [Lichtheimia corymbifera JMRC:FSU:9682]